MVLSRPQRRGRHSRPRFVSRSRRASSSHGVPGYSATTRSSCLRASRDSLRPVTSPLILFCDAGTQPRWTFGSYGGSSLRICPRAVENFTAEAEQWVDKIGLHPNVVACHYVAGWLETTAVSMPPGKLQALVRAIDAAPHVTAARAPVDNGCQNVDGGPPPFYIALQGPERDAELNRGVFLEPLHLVVEQGGVVVAAEGFLFRRH